MTVPAPTGDDQAPPDPDPAPDPPAAEPHTPERTQVFAEIAVAVVTAVSTVAGAVWLGGPWRKIIAFGMIVLVLLAVAHAWRFRADPARRTPHPVTVAVLAVGATVLLAPLLPSAVTDTGRSGAAPASPAPPSVSPASLPPPTPTIGPFTILRPGAQVPECSDVVGTGTIPAGYGLLLFVSATRGGLLFYEKVGKPSGDGTWLATTVHVGGRDDSGEFTITAVLVDAAWAAFFDKIETPAGLGTPTLPPGIPVGAVNVLRTDAKGVC